MILALAAVTALAAPTSAAAVAPPTSCLVAPLKYSTLAEVKAKGIAGTACVLGRVTKRYPKRRHGRGRLKRCRRGTKLLVTRQTPRAGTVLPPGSKSPSLAARYLRSSRSPAEPARLRLQSCKTSEGVSGFPAPRPPSPHRLVHGWCKRCWTAAGAINATARITANRPYHECRRCANQADAAALSGVGFEQPLPGLIGGKPTPQLPLTLVWTTWPGDTSRAVTAADAAPVLAKVNALYPLAPGAITAPFQGPLELDHAPVATPDEDICSNFLDLFTASHRCPLW